MRNVKTRKGFEYWDKICSLKHYGFLHSPDGKRVVKTEGIGNWIDKFEAQEIVDQAQDEVNQYRAERDVLQQRLTAANERNDLAIDLLRRARAIIEGGGWADLERDIAKFLKPCKLADHPQGEPVACAHEWTDDGQFTLTCTKCGKTENHEPYGWVQTRGNAINHFTQEWDVVESWEDQGFEYKAMFDHAEQPAPVAVVPELTSELRWILGQMCFQHIHTAQALRLMGHQIARKAEDEQAVTIYWMLGHYLKDPANWRRNASAEMKASAPTA